MNNRRFAIGIGILALIAIFARILPAPRTIDDAFITFRYARNILAGNGFIFNIGDPVLGTSTPLYTLVLVFLGSFLGGSEANFPQIAWIFNALVDAATVILLVLIGQRLNLKWAGWASALAWSIAPFSITFSIGGLETSTYVFLLIGTFYFYIRGILSISALMAGLSVLTRPDGLLLIIPLIVHRISRSRRSKDEPIRRSELLSLILPYGIWSVFAVYQFGSPIPHSVIAKSAAYQLESSTALIRLLQHYATPFQGHLVFGIAWIGIGIFLFPFLFFVGARKLIQHDDRVIPFLLFPWLHFLAFALANPLIFRWYLTPPLPFLFIFILVGLEDILEHISLKINPASIDRKIVPIFFVISIPAFLLFRDWQVHPDHGPDNPAPTMAWIELELLYAQAANFLISLPDWNVDSVVAAGDVGVIGYLTSAPILDLVGLNSSQSVSYYPLDKKAYSEFAYAIPEQLIADKRPDYVVFLEIYGRNTLLTNENFQQNYELVNSLQTDIYGSNNMLIYQLDN
jgi:hypothetical protein